MKQITLLKCDRCGYETYNPKSFSNHRRSLCNVQVFTDLECKYCGKKLPKRNPSEQGFYCNNKCYFKHKKGIRIGNRKERVLISNYWYVYAPNNPRAVKRTGYIPEQIFLMEQKINRNLTEDETVHHIDHNSLNNELSNLKLMTKHDHLSYHAQYKHSKSGGKKWKKESFCSGENGRITGNGLKVI